MNKPKHYDWTKHGDFKRYYDLDQKRNYWVLGYFGGGPIEIEETYELAKQFSEAVGVPLATVKIDEIFKSRRHKSFKYMYSSVLKQKPEEGTNQMLNVFQWLTD